MRSRRWMRVAGLVAACVLLLSGCFGEPDEPRRTETSRSAAPSEPAVVCKDTNPMPPVSPDVNPARCRWWADAEEIVGFDDIVVMTAEDESGQFTMSAVSALTGERVWTTPRIDGSDRKLKIVHWQGKPYASVSYRVGAKAAVTFVGLFHGADRTPVTWTGADAHPQLRVDEPGDDAVVAETREPADSSNPCGHVTTFEVIDPTTGQPRPLLDRSCLSVMTVGDGWYARSLGSEPVPVGVYDFAGALLWQLDGFGPSGADSVEPHDVVAAFGDRVVTRWAEAGAVNEDDRRVVAIHDRGGKVIASSTFGPFDDNDGPFVALASPNEKRLLVGSGGSGLIVDLATGQAVKLESGLRPYSITDEGTVYAVDWEGVPVVVNGATGKTTWTGNPDSLVPAAVVGGVAVVSSTRPSNILANKHFTATAWAFNLTRTEVAEKLAPLVRLHPQEQNRPTSVREFIGHAQLWWAHDNGCLSHLVAETVDESALANGAYRHRSTADHDPTHPLPCGEGDHVGQEFKSNENTHPKRSDDVPGDEGFYLDLEDAARGGLGTDAPVYWEYQHDDHTGVDAYVYWFFYAYNDFVNKHEGDWERVAVRVDGDKPLGVTFWRHHEPPCMVVWEKLKFEGGHPVVYSAKGSHGSYPRARAYRLTVPILGEINTVPVPTDHTDDGPPWETWRNALPVTEENWWNYGGAWGAIHLLKDWSGPDGPNPRYNKAQGALDANLCTVPDEFLGDWQSTTLVEGPTDAPSDIKLTLRSGDTGTTVGEIDHTGDFRRCSGLLELKEATHNTVVLTETVVSDPDSACDKQGTITLILEQGTLKYTYQGPIGNASDPEMLERN